MLIWLWNGLCWVVWYVTAVDYHREDLLGDKLESGLRAYSPYLCYSSRGWPGIELGLTVDVRGAGRGPRSVIGRERGQSVSIARRGGPPVESCTNESQGSALRRVANTPSVDIAISLLRLSGASSLSGSKELSVTRAYFSR